MSINYESAWKHLKTFVSDMEFHSKSSNDFQVVLLKMEELEKALTTDEPKQDVKIGDFTLERSKLQKFTAESHIEYLKTG